MGPILGGLILGTVRVPGQEGGWAVTPLFTNKSLSARASCCSLMPLGRGTESGEDPFLFQGSE